MRHQTSEIQTNKIGIGTNVWQNCVILEGAIIGENCNICFNVFVENDVVIGNNVVIKSGVQLWDGITLEDNVFVGPNVTFTNDLLPRSSDQQNDFKPERTIIKKGASIGANSTIICGITIGKNAMIGAGSVVTKNIPDHTLWFGNPARFKSYVCKCGGKLNENFFCEKCNRNYQFEEGQIEDKND